MEVLIHDLYHTQPESLRATIEHGGKSNILFSNCCEMKTFGRSFPNSRMGNNLTLIHMDSGIGYDYFFSDTRAENIARKSSAFQSSTLAGANAIRATDGNNDPLTGHLSVSETNSELNPWWQLLLPAGSYVQTVNIWPRNQQEWIPPIVSISIKSLRAYAQGYFHMTFSNMGNSESTSSRQNFITEAIPFGATAKEVTLAVQKIPDIGQVYVEVIALQPCTIDGCGSGNLERGLGYTYSITFLSIQAASPLVEVFNVSFLGGPVYIDGKLNTPNPENVVNFDISTSMRSIRKGQFIEVPFVKHYPKGYTPPEDNSTATVGDNPWLTPCWVMLFDETHTPPPNDLSAALNVAIWKYRFDSIDLIGQVILKNKVLASMLRIQRDAFGQLSLAEVEVYSEALNILQNYNHQVDVEPSPVTRPYQPGKVIV